MDDEYNQKKVNTSSRLLTCHLSIFLLILASYFAWVFNLPFLIKAFMYFKHDAQLSILHTLALIPFLICIFISLFSLLAIKKLEKSIFIFLTLLSSILSYHCLYYGLVFDGTSPLIDTLEHASWKEISLFLTPSFFIYFILFGMIPSYWIYKVRIVHPPWKKRLALRTAGVLLYPLVYAITGLPLSSTYQPLVRWSGLAGKAFFQIVPTNFFEDFYNYHYHSFIRPIPYRTLGLDAKIQHDQPNLLIIVVGETARGMNFELNGYPRATNNYTKKEGVVSFRHVESCGTCTRVSVPCMFSYFPRKQFFNIIADSQDNLLDVLQHAGVHLLWVDNNGNGNCQGVCKHIESILLDAPFDEVCVDTLKHRIDTSQHQDMVIVLHLRGSHGIDYYTKYPPEFAEFKPACQRNEFRLCSKKALINAYDNSLLYTDFVIKQLIQVLKKQTTFKHAALIYTSDHGESLGEHNLHEHCSPYPIAPVEQTHVPLIFWASDAWMSDQKLSLSCLQNKAYEKHLSHDNLFHSVLGLMDINTDLYQQNLDIFRSCRA